MIDRFIYKADEDFCYPRPCAIGTVYQPSISSKHPFLAIGAFVFPPKQVGALGDDGVIQPQDLLNKGVAFCQQVSPMPPIPPARLPPSVLMLYLQSLDVAMNKTGQKGDFLSTECLMSLYMSKLFTNGYGFANDTQQIVGTSEVAEWSIGKISSMTLDFCGQFWLSPLSFQSGPWEPSFTRRSAPHVVME